MLNPISASRAMLNPVPKVLMEAKKEAAMQASEKENLGKGHYDKGPWDDGHWANRK